MNVQETAADFAGKPEESILPHIRKYIPGLTAAALSALMNRASLPGGYFPLGAAFMAAVPQNHAAAAAVGGVISCLTDGAMLTSMEGLRHIAALLAVGGIRWAFGELRWVNRAKFYPFFAAFAGVLMTNTVINGTIGSVISYSTLYFIIEGLMAGLAAMFFSGACHAAELTGSGERLSRIASVSLIITLGAAAIPLCRFRLFGISPGMILIHAAVLLIVSVKRETGGAVAGISAGFVASLAKYSMIQGAVIPVAALLAGYAAFFGRIFAASAYIACCFMGCLAAGSPDYILIAEAAAGGIISCLVPAAYAERALAAAGFLSTGEPCCRAENAAAEKLSDAAEAISGVCSVLNRVSEGLEKRLTTEEDSFRGHALSKTSGIRSMINGQLEGMGMMLERLSSELLSEKADGYSSGRIAEHLTACGYDVFGCSCVTRGNGRMIISLTVRCRDDKSEAEEIAACAGEYFGFDFEAESAESLGDTLAIRLGQKKRYALVCEGVQHCCSGEKLCGDSYDSFEDGQGTGFMLLSDGMGSGGRAAVEGALTCELFRRLLGGGFDFDSAVKIVNSALMLKSEEEMLSTADCLKVNLYNGRAEISKAGAAQSYHVRDGFVTRIDLPSLPLGILCETDTARYAFTAEHGDMIVMISDGVPTDDSLWFENILKSGGGMSAGELARLLLKNAVSRRPEGEDDDITVTIGTIV